MCKTIEEEALRILKGSNDPALLKVLPYIQFKDTRVRWDLTKDVSRKTTTADIMITFEMTDQFLAMTEW